jgi:hypothetical protein
MRRREFITSLGALTAWPLTARAQQSERMRHIGILMAFSENDPEAQSWAQTFSAGVVASSGDTEGSNRLIEFLASARASEAIRNSGMEPLATPR